MVCSICHVAESSAVLLKLILDALQFYFSNFVAKQFFPVTVKAASLIIFQISDINKNFQR